MTVVTDTLSRFTPIGWSSPFGYKLAEGYYWGQCPNCAEECIFTPTGIPTATHRDNGERP